MAAKIDDSWYVKPDGVKTEVAAGGVVVRPAGSQILVALIREGTLPAYVLPKGHLEPGESLLATARREIEEEAGFSTLKYLGDLGSLERLDYKKKHWKITHYYLFVTDQIDAIPTDAAMSYRVEWFPLEQLPDIFWPEQRTLVEENIDQIRQALAAQN